MTKKVSSKESVGNGKSNAVEAAEPVKKEANSTPPKNVPFKDMRKSRTVAEPNTNVAPWSDEGWDVELNRPGMDQDGDFANFMMYVNILVGGRGGQGGARRGQRQGFGQGAHARRFGQGLNGQDGSQVPAQNAPRFAGGRFGQGLQGQGQGPGRAGAAQAGQGVGPGRFWRGARGQQGAPAQQGMGQGAQAPQGENAAQSGRFGRGGQRRFGQAGQGGPAQGQGAAQNGPAAGRFRNPGGQGFGRAAPADAKPVDVSPESNSGLAPKDGWASWRDDAI